MSGRGKKAAPKKKANGYKMPAPIATGEVIHDTIGKKKWRIGPSIGVGGFGEIYSACDHEASPKKGSNYPFVIKIEPHENGPLFVEKHFYVRNTNKDDIAKFMQSNKLSTLGMPSYYGNGSHEYKGEKYRYLVLERYGKDLWTIFKENGRSFPLPTVFQIGLQMLDVLQYIHARGYVHADLKGANILLGLKKGTENQAYLVDFGLATRVQEKEFKPDPKCAHNGTIEYTSRDAHLGVATMRGDLEILGYNLLQWAGGQLPWEQSLARPQAVQEQKEAFLKNVRANITKQYKDVPEALIKFFEYINSLKPKDTPDYTKCRNLFLSYLKSASKTRTSKLEFTTKKATKVQNDSDTDDDQPLKSPKKTVRRKAPKENGEAKVVKKRKPAKAKEATKELESENCENETPNGTEVKAKKTTKRKSIEPKFVANIKKTKLAPKATPQDKRSAASAVSAVSVATQTSGEKRKRSPRQVSFDSPICEVIGERSRARSANSSGDIFDDSFTLDGKKKRRLLADEELVVKRVVKKRVTKTKGRSWRDAPAVVNGRAVAS